MLTGSTAHPPLLRQQTHTHSSQTLRLRRMETHLMWHHQHRVTQQEGQHSLQAPALLLKLQRLHRRALQRSHLRQQQRSSRPHSSLTY